MLVYLYKLNKRLKTFGICNMIFLHFIIYKGYIHFGKAEIFDTIKYIKNTVRRSVYSNVCLLQSKLVIQFWTYLNETWYTCILHIAPHCIKVGNSQIGAIYCIVTKQTIGRFLLFDKILQPNVLHHHFLYI